MKRSKIEQFAAETLRKNSVKQKKAFYESYGCFKETEGPPARSSSILTGRKLCGKAYNIVAIVQQLSQLKPVSAAEACRQNVTRFRLYRLRFLQENTRFALIFRA